MERKLIELLIGEDGMGLPVEAISLVKFPAIEENFLFFSKGKNTKALSLAQVDEEKRTLIGAALIPDKNIPRYDEMNDEEYDVFFSKETVKLASEMYMKNSRTNEHTLEHEVAVEDVHVVESWIVTDPDMDKSKHYGLNLPEGSWCVRMKVENDELWSQVKEGSIRGLSIEGYFIDKVEEMSVKVKTPNFKKSFKKLWFNIKRKFYSEITLSDGVVIATEEAAFQSGTTVIAIDDEGLPTELANGKYTTQQGVNLEVFEGVLIEWDGEVEAIEESQAEAENDEEVEMEKVELDQMKVKYYKALLKGKMKGYLGNSTKLSILEKTKKEIKMSYKGEIFETWEGNIIRIDYERSDANGTYFSYTITQPNGYWQDSFEEYIKDSMYYSVEEFLDLKYQLK
tara:strand:+ start:14982 stop:16172 length:1191 start_codon:yes stop_codon:yes gene_type:complete